MKTKRPTQCFTASVYVDAPDLAEGEGNIRLRVKKEKIDLPRLRKVAADLFESSQGTIDMIHSFASFKEAGYKVHLCMIVYLPMTMKMQMLPMDTITEKVVEEIRVLV